MIVGVPKEIKEEEYRVGMTPAGVRQLTTRGHRVLFQSTAGEGCRLHDQELAAAGAEIVSSPEEIYARSDMVVKVKEPLDGELDMLRQGQMLFAYLHLAPAPELTDALLERGIIGIAYETIQLEDGSLPLLIPMSEVAGRMAVQVGAHYLENVHGGRGVLLGGVPGVSRGHVTVLGAGSVGRAAAKIAVGIGAEVTILDVDIRRLVYMDDVFGSRVTTMFSHCDNVHFAVARSHLVVGAVLIPGARTPHVVTRQMISEMRPGTVVVDVSIDQGGCVETSRPTTHRDPTFLVDDVIHYCVPNMPGVVARTSTYALTSVTLPYVLSIAEKGLAEAVRMDPALSKGLNLFNGRVTHEKVASSLGRPYTPLETLRAELP